MPRSNRGLIIAAIFGLAVISFGAGATLTSFQQGQPTSYSGSEEAGARERYARAAAAFEKTKSPTDFAAFPSLSLDKCYLAPDHDAADLCAQWRAALAAEKAASAAWWAVCWTIIGAILSGFGLGALLITLGQTERSIKQSNEAIRLENRAWMGSGNPEILKLINPETKAVLGASVSFPFENVGSTPALKVAALLQVQSADAASNLSDTDLGGHVVRDTDTSSLSPRGSVSAGPVMIPAAQCVRICEGKERLLFRAYVTYRDIFGTEVRISETTVVFSGGGDKRIFLNPDDNTAFFSIKSVTNHQSAT